MNLLPDTKVGAADWMLQAACRGLDPNLFFESNTARAANVCRGCPVTDHCSTYVRTQVPADEARFGVWGGQGPSERGVGKATSDWSKHRPICDACHQPYEQHHWKQRYCDDTCRATGKRLKNQAAQQRKRAAA